MGAVEVVEGGWGSRGCGGWKGAVEVLEGVYTVAIKMIQPPLITRLIVNMYRLSAVRNEQIKQSQLK